MSPIIFNDSAAVRAGRSMQQMSGVHAGVRDTAMKLAAMKQREEENRADQSFREEKRAQDLIHRQLVLDERQAWNKREDARLMTPRNRVGITPAEMSGTGILTMLESISSTADGIEDYDFGELEGLGQWIQAQTGQIIGPDNPLTADMLDSSPALRQIYQTVAEKHIELRTRYETEESINAYADAAQTITTRYPEWAETEDGLKELAGLSNGIRRATNASVLNSTAEKEMADMALARARSAATRMSTIESYRDDIEARISEKKVRLRQRESAREFLDDMDKGQSDPEALYIRALRALEPEMERAAAQGAADQVIQSSANHAVFAERRRAAEAVTPEARAAGTAPGPVGGMADEDPPEEIQESAPPAPQQFDGDKVLEAAEELWGKGAVDWDLKMPKGAVTAETPIEVWKGDTQMGFLAPGGTSITLSPDGAMTAGDVATEFGAQQTQAAPTPPPGKTAPAGSKMSEAVNAAATDPETNALREHVKAIPDWASKTKAEKLEIVSEFKTKYHREQRLKQLRRNPQMRGG